MTGKYGIYSAGRVNQRQSQPASATLRKIFEKDLLWCQKIEFFPWPGVDL